MAFKLPYTGRSIKYYTVHVVSCVVLGVLRDFGSAPDGRTIKIDNFFSPLIGRGWHTRDWEPDSKKPGIYQYGDRGKTLCSGQEKVPIYPAFLFFLFFTFRKELILRCFCFTYHLLLFYILFVVPGKRNLTNRDARNAFSMATGLMNVQTNGNTSIAHHALQSSTRREN